MSSTPKSARLTPAELARWEAEQPKSYANWLAMRPGDFDTEAPDMPLALFALPDPCGTPDLFDTAG